MRAQAIADYLETNTREGYAAEKAKDAADGKARAEEARQQGTETPTPAWGRFHQGGGRQE